MKAGLLNTTRGLAVAGPLLLMLLLAWTPGISFTEDLGRHLLLGKIITERHAVPKTNLLTYTHPDFPFVNHHWLSEVFFYQLHRFVGLNGLIVFKMLAMAGALALAAIAMPVPKRGTGIYWLAGILAAVVLAFRAHIRPELFTYLGIGFFLYCFERMRNGARWPWVATPIYLWFWSNAQIYFVFGLGMAVAFVFDGTRHRGGVRLSQLQFRKEVLWLALLLVVCSLNPNGFSGLLYPFQIFSNYEMQISENVSPLEYWRIVINPMLIALPFLSVLTLVSIPSCWRARPANAIIALAALAASWKMARSVPLLALSSLPCIACWLEGGLQVADRRFRVSRFQFPSSSCIAFALTLWLCFSILSGSYSRTFPSPIAPTPFGFDDESRFTAIRRLKAAGLHGPVFSDYNLGSLVEYNMYPEPGYVDNRPEAFPGSFWRAEYLPALALTETWDRISAVRQINAVIVSLFGVPEPFTRGMMRRSEWALVSLDALSGIWVRKTAENQALIDRFNLDDYVEAISKRLEQLSSIPLWRRQVEAERIVYELYSLTRINETPRAWPGIWRMHQLYPDFQIVHELMRVSAPPERVEEVKQVLARRARWPVAAKQVLDWGRVLEREGRVDEAHEVYERGRRFFPLSAALRGAAARVDDSR